MKEKQNKKLKTEAGHQNCPRSLSMCWIFEISLNKRIAALIWVFNIWLDWIDFKLKPQYKVDIRYLEYPLSGTFSSVSSALSVTALVNSFGFSNPAISNFHYAKLFSRSLQRFLGLSSIHYLECFHLFECWQNTFENFDRMFIFSYFNKTTCRMLENC